MKCDMTKEQLIGYFYKDFSPGDNHALDAHLSRCPACKKRLQEFEETTALLSAWKDEDPNLNLNFVQESVSLVASLRKAWSVGNAWRRFAVGFTAGLAAVLLVLSLANLEVSYSQGSFGARMSLLPRQSATLERPGNPLEAPLTKGEFAALQEESMRLIHQVLEATERRQHRNLDLKLAAYARELDALRRHDLQLVGHGIEVYQLSNENRFRRTNQTLEELIQLAQLTTSERQLPDNK